MDSAGVECGLKILGMGLLPGDSAAHKCAASNIPVNKTSTPMVRPTTTDPSRISLFSAIALFLTQNLNPEYHLFCVSSALTCLRPRYCASPSQSCLIPRHVESRSV